MRARANYQVWVTTVWLLLALAGCGKPRAPRPPAQAADLGLATNTAARLIPRRIKPLVVTNRITMAPQPQRATNTAPVVTCSAPQSLPCMPPEGVQATLSAHVEDADGNALSVVWNVDGKDRYTQQVPASGPPTSADLTFAYDFTPGDHAIKVTVSDGSLSATCNTTLTIQKDTENPVIVCPRDITVPADPGSCSAVVTFSPKATDNCPDVTVVCSPPSGTAFPIGTTPVTGTATDAAGNVSECVFAVTVQVTNRCPHNDRFWGQHPGAWPVNSLGLGSQVYSPSQLQPLLRTTIPSDASMALAAQLIAASLNTANGSDPRPICNELAQANAILAGFTGKLPFRVSLTSAAGRAMMELATRLNGYNNGMLTPNCVP
jgi:HYR domain